MKIPITSIVEGHVNELLGLNTDIATSRLNICKLCPIYSIEYGGVCSNKLWINPETDEVSRRPLPDYVQGCGCRLLAKTTLPYAKCPASKW